MRAALLPIVLCVGVGVAVDGQGRRRASQRAAPAPVTEPASLLCDHVLGDGVATGRSFCDIQIGVDPAAGAIVKLPARQGPATLTFDLHNRHMYSAELVQSGRGYVKATATIGVLAMDRRLLTRAVIMTEFRTVADLYDRVSAGAGLPGVKAVAPIGIESIVVEIPADVDAVSLLGEKLVAAKVEGIETITAANRPVAVVSNLRVQYRPRPSRR